MDTNEYTSAQRGFFSEAEPTERLTLYVMFINVICGLVSILLPLVPSPIEAFSGRRVLYNLLGVVNQQVGGDTTRTDAFPLLLLYYVAVIVMAAGCVSAFYRLKSSMLFTLVSAVCMVVFVVDWLDEETLGQDPFAASFAKSLLPAMLIFFASAAIISAVVALGLGLSSKPKKIKIQPRK